MTPYLQLLAVYTFRGLWIGVLSESLRVTKILVTGIWVFVTLMIVLGNILHLHEDNQHRFIAPVPVSENSDDNICPFLIVGLQYWCWIGSDYTQWRLWGQYFWFWLTLAVSILTYIPIFLWSRGVIAPHPQSWWRFRRVGNDFSRELENLAKIMLAYAPHVLIKSESAPAQIICQFLQIPNHFLHNHPPAQYCSLDAFPARK